MNKKLLKYIFVFILGWLFCSVQCLLLSIYSHDDVLCVFPFTISFDFDQNEYRKINETKYYIFSFPIMKTYTVNLINPKIDGFPDSFDDE